MSNWQTQLEKIKAIEASGKKLRTSEFYGIDEVILQYLGLPSFFPLKYLCYLDHGISLHYTQVSKTVLNAKNELILVNTSSHQKAVKAKIQAPVFVLGPTFVHYRLLHGISPSPSATGTLVFPSHSTHTITTQFNWEQYADELLALPDEYHPIKVCLYWKDILHGREKVFTERNIEVVTSGHMYDKQFIANFYSLLANTRFVTSNAPTSSIFYALEMGIPAYLFGERAKYKTTNPVHLIGRGEKEHKIYEEVVDSLTLNPFEERPAISSTQKAIIDRYIDREHWDPPGLIKNALLKNALPFLWRKGLDYLRS